MWAQSMTLSLLLFHHCIMLVDIPSIMIELWLMMQLWLMMNLPCVFCMLTSLFENQGFGFVSLSLLFSSYSFAGSTIFLDFKIWEWFMHCYTSRMLEQIWSCCHLWKFKVNKKKYCRIWCVGCVKVSLWCKGVGCLWRSECWSRFEAELICGSDGKEVLQDSLC